ncbi:MAG: hypothetical protein HY902_00455 [Deltaproteobacteria bacterium]|nr:hypothetical protein [Deltaproteobacteria bacterium]
MPIAHAERQLPGSVRPRVWLAALLCAALPLTACSHLVDIKPSELPKLSDVAAAPAAAAGTPQANPLWSAGRVVEAPNGKKVHIEGFARVHVFEFGQRAVEHDRPLVAHIHDGDLLDITSAGAQPVTYALPNIQRMSLEVYDVGATTAVFTAVTLAGTTLLTLMLVAAIN